MTPEDVSDLMEATLAGMPIRASGNEAALQIERVLCDLLPVHRAAVCAALAGYIGWRRDDSAEVGDIARHEAMIWIALLVAKKLALRELVTAVADLARDVIGGLVLRRADIESVRNDLRDLMS